VPLNSEFERRLCHFRERCQLLEALQYRQPGFHPRRQDSNKTIFTAHKAFRHDHTHKHRIADDWNAR
jgi:hypothetical protein